MSWARKKNLLPGFHRSTICTIIKTSRQRWHRALEIGMSCHYEPRRNASELCAKMKRNLKLPLRTKQKEGVSQRP